MVFPLIAAAGISALGSLIGGSQQSKAAKKAAEAQAQSQAAALAAQKEAAAKVVTLQQPGVDVWGKGLNALTGRLGLPSQGVDGGKTLDTAAYGAANPDVVAAYEAYRAGGGDRDTYQGVGSLEDYERRHYEVAGKAEGRTAPLIDNPNALTGGYGHTVDPTWNDPGDFAYTAEDYKASPGFAYRLDQGLKAALSHSSATGALQSGATLKALQDRGDQIAYDDFDQERDAARGIFNDNTNRRRNIYESDRGYLTDRADQTTDDLFRYTGVGQSAVNTTSNALTGVGQAGADAAIGTGNAQAGNALQQGNIWSGVVGDVAGAIAGLVKPKVSTAVDWTKTYNLAGGS